MTKKRVVLYLGMVFVITWGASLLFARGLGGAGAVRFFFLSGYMLLPALCCFFTRALTREGLANLWIAPKEGRHILKNSVSGWIIPVVLTVIGAGVYFLFFHSQFDPSMSVLVDPLMKQMSEAGQPVSAAEITGLVYKQLATSVALSPVLYLFLCLGETLGWHGYLLPKLCALTRSPFYASLLTGAIWGIWYTPMVTMGHFYGFDYAGYPYLGVFAMLLFCIFVGFLFSYLTLVSKSVLPAAFANGSLIGAMSLPSVFTLGDYNGFLGPLPTGILGGIGFIALGVLLALAMLRRPEHYTVEETEV